MHLPSSLLVPEDAESLTVFGLEEAGPSQEMETPWQSSNLSPFQANVLFFFCLFICA
jgi:hypothetical protein